MEIKMLGKMINLSGLIFLAILLISCSGYSENNMDYNQVKSMPGYGYILFDFSKSKEIKTGRNYSTEKTGYTIHYYKNNGHSLFVHIDNADFDRSHT